MPRTRTQPSVRSFFDNLWELIAGPRGVEDGTTLLGEIRQRSPEEGSDIDRLLLSRLLLARRELDSVNKIQEELREAVQKLSATPWHPALFLRPVETQLGERALVSCNRQRRLVELSDEVEGRALVRGQAVFLSRELNLLMATAPAELMEFGETAFFDHLTEDGRLVLKQRDEEYVVEAASSLGTAQLCQGDRVRWDRDAWLAFEQIESNEGRQFITEDVDDIGPEMLGGQDACLEELLMALTVNVVNPQLAQTYGLGGRRSVLLVGPPGVGKTRMTRIAASMLQRISGKTCRFAAVKPGEFTTPWIGETEQNIRNCFKALREEAGDGLAVLFLDEIESIGRVRGRGLGSDHADRFLAALLAEIDGFGDRGNVALVTATNRKDLVDPALLQRLSDVEIAVQRPNLRAAREIFDVHLGESYPYATNGVDASSTRREIIESALSCLYAPNGEGALCELQFRDGKRRTIHARELMSGRLIEQIATDVRNAAFHRNLRTGETGIRQSDMEAAAARALEKLRSTLTINNVHDHIDDLPQDNDVVRVAPVIRKVQNTFRYVNAA
jgi:proteasome-associated ATPase